MNTSILHKCKAWSCHILWRCYFYTKREPSFQFATAYLLITQQRITAKGECRV